MYLFERLIGVFTYTIILFLFFFLIHDGRINYKKLLIIYLIILSILAFFYIPPETEDLYRTFIIVGRFQKVTFSSFLPTLSETSYPIAMLFYYFVSKIGIYGIIPALATFITYKNGFYILKICADKYKLSNKEIAIIFLFTMSTGMFGYLVTNIRALVALSILAKCFVLEFCDDTKISKNFIYYIICVFIHPISFFVIMIRIIFGLFFEKNIRITTKCVIFFLLFSFYLVFRSYFNYAYQKFLRYFYEGTYFWIFEFVKILFLDFFLILLGLKSKKIRCSDILQGNQTKNITNLVFVFLIIIFCLTEFNIYMRVSYFLALVSIPFLCYYIKKSSNNYRYKTIVLFSLLLLFLSCTRGHLSSFKFVLFN